MQCARQSWALKIEQGTRWGFYFRDGEGERSEQASKHVKVISGSLSAVTEVTSDGKMEDEWVRAAFNQWPKAHFEGVNGTEEG